MNRVRSMRSVMLVVAALAIVGCKSKQETPAANSTAPVKSAEAVKTISGQNTTGASEASPQDRADAEAAAARVLAQMEAGEFSGIYQKAAPGFKQIGKEADFVAMFQRTRQKTGLFTGAQKASFVARPDQTFVLVYHVENERFKSERRLTLARSKSGEMELFGLNQHDEPKKVASQ